MKTKVRYRQYSVFRLCTMVVLGLLFWGLSYGSQTYKTWYLDADNDGYSDGTSVLSDSQPGTGYVSAELLFEDRASKLEIKAFLGGAYDSGTERMRDDRRVYSIEYPEDIIIPTEDPFTALGYDLYSETGAVLGTGVLAVEGDDAFVDRVIIEFRDAEDPSYLVATKLAYIQRDGDIVNLDGEVLFVDMTQAGSYYIAVKQRNHMRVMTAAPVTVGASDVVIDFSVPTTATYGTPTQRNIDGVLVMTAGDFDNNDRIDEDDEAIVFDYFSNGYYGGFYAGDLYLDGFGDSLDISLFNLWYMSYFSGDAGLPAIATQAAENIFDRSFANAFLIGDCDDENTDIYPEADEICDDIDNDCDGLVDDADDTVSGIVWYEDADNDGFGNVDVIQSMCEMPVGYVLDNADCNDENDAISPVAPEVCDDVDNDCSGQIDDALDCREGRKGSSSLSSPGSPSFTSQQASVSQTKSADSDVVEIKSDNEDFSEHASADDESIIMPFTDVPEQAAYADAIYFLQEKGVIEGVIDAEEQRRYEPYRVVTKGEFYKMVVGLLYTTALEEDENRAMPYAVFLKNFDSVRPFIAEDLEEPIDLKDVLTVLVAVCKDLNMIGQEKKVPNRGLGRFVRRYEIAEILKSVVERMQD